MTAATSVAAPLAPSSEKRLDLEAPLLVPSGVVVKRAVSTVAILLALAGMVWGSVAQSEASQALQEKGRFNKPFFITCFNHSLAWVLIPLVSVYFKMLGESSDVSWLNFRAVIHRRSVLPADKLVSFAFCFSVFSLFADYLWYAALTGVSVTAANAISNCSPLFVYCFSICLLGEGVACRKVCGVLVAFAGVTFIVLNQDATRDFDLTTVEDRSVVAGLLVVVSSVFYAAYQVAFKFALGAELTDTTTILLLTGLSGVFTIPLWIVGSVAVAHSPFPSLYEPFALPETSEGVILLFVSGSLAVLVNVSMPLVLCWTTPLETSVGGMLVVPFAGVWDVVFHHTHFSSQCILGSLLVLLGFGILEFPPSRSAEVESAPRKPRDEEAVGLLKDTGEVGSY